MTVNVNEECQSKSAGVCITARPICEMRNDIMTIGAMKLGSSKRLYRNYPISRVDLKMRNDIAGRKKESKSINNAIVVNMIKCNMCTSKHPAKTILASAKRIEAWKSQVMEVVFIKSEGGRFIPTLSVGIKLARGSALWNVFFVMLKLLIYR